LQYLSGFELFLEGNNAVFVIVVRLDEPGDIANSVWYWLRFIKTRLQLHGTSESPLPESSRPHVVMVGSMRDMAVKACDSTRQGQERWISDRGEDILKMVSHWYCVDQGWLSWSADRPCFVFQAKQKFSDTFNLNDRFFVLDCRLPDDPDMAALRRTLADSYASLQQDAQEVPQICEQVRQALPELRRQQKVPIISVQSLLIGCDANLLEKQVRADVLR
jgi:hypothetical protein